MSTPDTLTRELDALDDALAGRAVDPDLADLAELAVALRDDRPAPDPAFTRTLDTRVERGFPRAARARKRRGIKWPRVTLPALGVAASVVLVAVIVTSIPTGGDENGVGGSGSGSGAGGSVATTEEAQTDSASKLTPAAKRAAGDESASSGSAPPSTPSTPSTSAPSTAIAPLPPTAPSPGAPPADRTARRSVERSAELVLAAPPREIDRAAAEILRVTDELGGYVVSSTVSSNSSGQFELRVPERKLQAALSRLSRVAKVRQRTQAAQDITGAVVSVRERLKDARTERRSLLRQLAAATTPNQTSSIRGRLRLVSGQIAAAKRDLGRVQTRASRSTIAVTLLADRRSTGGDEDDGAGGWTPADAFDDAVRILEVTAGVLLVAVALLLPLGLVGLLVWLAARQAAQRRRERALDAV
jgi:uncharacterized protein DUF4349